MGIPWDNPMGPTGPMKIPNIISSLCTDNMTVLNCSVRKQRGCRVRVGLIGQHRRAALRARAGVRLTAGGQFRRRRRSDQSGRRHVR